MEAGSYIQETGAPAFDGDSAGRGLSDPGQ